MAGIELKAKVAEVLSRHPGQRYSARDLAVAIAAAYPDEVQAKKERSRRLESAAALLSQIVAEIGAHRPSLERDYPQVRTTDGVRPRLYYWTTRTEEEEVEDVEEHGLVEQALARTVSDHESPPPPARLTEHDLYPRLIQYLEAEYPAKGFRIDEKRSSNSLGLGGNRWLYPDVVGIENLTDGMHEEVRETVRQSRDRQLRLWSFEVKLLINRSNARETYFQAVSNSAWANLGYLVAASFEGVDTLKELRILYSVHGIGLIKLDTDDPTESEILVPARERADIEWPMCSRLASENSDFRSYMRTVRHFYQTGDL